MIPKRIHYCWFGKSEKPKLALRCIESWKKYCPDYELVEWNEDNFDTKYNSYVKQAYDYKKYAFVSDYVRLFAMYNFGGIYMDTDVEVVKPLDEFLMQQAFSGFELPEYVPTGIMGCHKGLVLFEEFLNYYSDKMFIDDHGNLDMTTNTSIITKILENYGLKKDNSYQVIQELALYPRDYFCPYDDATGELLRTQNTHAVHWFSKSWIEPKYRVRSRITRVFHRLFGNDCFCWLKKLVNE